MQLDPVAQEHLLVTRRWLLRNGLLGTAAAASQAAMLGWPRWLAADEGDRAALDQALAGLEGKYLTKAEDFGTVERGNPLPYTLPEEQLKAKGLLRESWTLEVLADPQSNSKLEQPLTHEAGTALTFADLLKLAETKAVRCLKIMTCNNGGSPLGMGLWEGVPLRDVVWLTRPQENIRQVFYHGYYNEDPAQIFQCWLPINRVLEDPPGELPVLLCYKLNGQWLSGKRGGPVRMLVPEAYGFKSVKWLKRVVLTNNHQADDTYAKGNNDIHSWMKTFAKFLSAPGNVRPQTATPITGVAQVGISGLSRVQYWVHPAAEKWPEDDPYFLQAPWQDAELLPAPKNWGAEIGTELPAMNAVQFDPQSNQPRQWPLRYTLAHWAALVPPLTAGKYDLRCRTIDAQGQAQPMPRPFAKSGRNPIQRVPLIVSEA